MKGMQKIIRGYGFKAVLLYCEGRGEKKGVSLGRLLGGNMTGETVPELLREFVAARRIRPDIKKASWHNSLRLPPGEQITDERWLEVAEDYVSRMGFSPTHPYCVWAHDDEFAIHIIASRIGYSGTVYLGRNENLVSTRHIQILEHDFNLSITKGPTYLNPYDSPESFRPVQPERTPLRKAEIDLAFRLREEPTRLRLQRLIDVAIADKPSVVEFAERMEYVGVQVRANLSSIGLMGFSFGVAGVRFKGSELGRIYSYKGLMARGLSYDKARDNQSLQRFSTAVRTTEVSNGTSAPDVKHDHPDRAAGREAVPLGSSLAGSLFATETAGDRYWRVDGPDHASAVSHSGPLESAEGGPDECGGTIDQNRVGLGGGSQRHPPADVERWARSEGQVGMSGGFERIASEDLGGEALVVQENLVEQYATEVEALRQQTSSVNKEIEPDAFESEAPLGDSGQVRFTNRPGR